MLGKNYSRHFVIFFPRKLSPKSQILFSGKKKRKNVINLSSAEFDHSMVSVNAWVRGLSHDIMEASTKLSVFTLKQNVLHCDIEKTYW